MPDGPIKVTFGELQAAAGSINTNAGRIQTALDDLKTFLAPLVSTWTGNAAEMYQQHQNKWDQAAGDLQAVLSAIGIAVGRAAEDYMDGERTNAARW
jgi:early secretory antigenic target protein ESAT-6